MDQQTSPVGSVACRLQQYSRLHQGQGGSGPPWRCDASMSQSATLRTTSTNTSQPHTSGNPAASVCRIVTLQRVKRSTTKQPAGLNPAVDEDQKLLHADNAPCCSSTHACIKVKAAQGLLGAATLPCHKVVRTHHMRVRKAHHQVHFVCNTAAAAEEEGQQQM
jgi:hypothetical protein